MTGAEAERFGRRIAIHLRRNEFEKCYDILRFMESQAEKREEDNGRIPLAEVFGQGIRHVNLLEAEGYSYADDLDGIDPESFSTPGNLNYIKWFGKQGVKEVEEALRRVRLLHKKRQRAQEELERRLCPVGEPLHVGPYTETRGANDELSPT